MLQNKTNHEKFDKNDNHLVLRNEKEKKIWRKKKQLRFLLNKQSRLLCFLYFFFSLTFYKIIENMSVTYVYL